MSESELQVIGVATAIIKEANNICYIIPLPVIQSFLRAATALLAQCNEQETLCAAFGAGGLSDG